VITNIFNEKTTLPTNPFAEDSCDVTVSSADRSHMTDIFDSDVQGDPDREAGK